MPAIPLSDLMHTVRFTIREWNKCKKLGHSVSLRPTGVTHPAIIEEYYAIHTEQTIHCLTCRIFAIRRKTKIYGKVWHTKWHATIIKIGRAHV